MNHHVPIIIQRHAPNGTQELINYPFLGNNFHETRCLQDFREKKNKFNTLDHKKENVRIRRVQSSGTKRKFPKDFFSRESNKAVSHRHIANVNSGRVSKTAEQRERKEINMEEKILETPKFKEKPKEICNEKQLKQDQEEVIIPLNLNSNNKEGLNRNLVFMQNTFSANTFINSNKETTETKGKNVQKENQPKKKSKTPREIHCKKFSLIKEKTGYFRLRNIFQ